MNQLKRYHPLLILLECFQLVKVYFVSSLFILGMNFDSESRLFSYGAILFFSIVSLSFIYILLKWLTNKYEVDETSFHLYKGIFTKTKVSIPYNKIQNVNYHTSVFHRMFRVTSLKFETALTDESGTITFKVISQNEAMNLKTVVDQAVFHNDVISENNLEESAEKVERMIHFRPTKKELYRASFLSFSFLLLLPLLASVFFTVNDAYNLENEAEGVVEYVLHSKWLLAVLIFIFIVVSITFGIVKTFWKYGNYEISSDTDRIYIKTGLVEESGFSILKSRVQAIEMDQSLIQKAFQLVEIKLICISSSDEDDDVQINVLYPYLPYKQAFALLSEILPSFTVTDSMEKLPKKSLFVKLLEPSWFWIIVTTLLIYFKPVFLGSHTWWIISITLFIIIYVLRIVDYMRTRYTVNNHFVQFQSGSIITTLFITKREKIIELKVERTFFQRLFGLASITTVNRAKPIHCTVIKDIPIEMSRSMVHWYAERKNEIVVCKE